MVHILPLLNRSATRSLRFLAKPSTARFYSAPTGPQILVTDIPAPSTGRIRILSLNRPSARNAISRSLLADLRAQIDEIAAEYDAEGNEIPLAKTYGGAAGPNERGRTRAVILSSEVETCFCAGADLKERAGMSREETDAFLANLRNTFSAFAALPIPTIAAVSSMALGGGLELALCAHLRVFASTAIVGLPETRLGIIPGAGGTYRLPGVIGQNRARDMILTGRRVSAPEAYFLGLADRLVEVVEAEGLKEGEEDKDLLKRAGKEALNEAVRLATEICSGGPVAARAAIQATAWCKEEVENKAYETVVATEDRDEALKAFREKRLPVFKGR
ncbi:hypothetical protein V495_04994 [Pseudogymnoascus sp. VKM F-4514 (FW-929)]|nr:hypothetical protein V490_05407 [Pseudogymnoascus sp. VKM F-3557]KFY41298.1 hypothetical protein V495_04994 [Pseudogymnoascus sp. VKM F-4514 (FW-929)]KFY55859.1 hypothetical protein V497_06674 [Pseudogymnoascus sp. VKM F-4516 (FW-969)]